MSSIMSVRKPRAAIFAAYGLVGPVCSLEHAPTSNANENAARAAAVIATSDGFIVPPSKRDVANGRITLFWFRCSKILVGYIDHDFGGRCRATLIARIESRAV